MDEDAFDPLSQGSGCTWLAVLAAYEQRKGGPADVHSFFGKPAERRSELRGLLGLPRRRQFAVVGERATASPSAAST